MVTVLLSGVGAVGGWALEFLARAEGVDRIVTIKRGPWNGPPENVIAMLGSSMQGFNKQFEHFTVDLADTSALASILSVEKPAVVVHSATIQSPRHVNKSHMEERFREAVRKAAFGMWLPWHLRPASLLMEGISAADIDTHVVNIAFPDVTNVALWQRYGWGPTTGAGNVEVCAARVLRYAMEQTGYVASRINVSLVGSHALLVYPGGGVPHHFRLEVDGQDVTDQHDLERILSSWPEPIDWGASPRSSLFAASAVKNAMAILGTERLSTHVTAPNGLPGGYPAVFQDGRVELDLPPGLGLDEAVAINRTAAQFDGIDEIGSDGTIRYTEGAAEAMAQLGYPYREVAFDQLEARSGELLDVYRRITNEQ